jgi:hypothetical protein
VAVPAQSSECHHAQADDADDQDAEVGVHGHIE